MNDVFAAPLCLPEGDLWVFGYGSLMWRPGFEYKEMHTARLYGYHRALCIWSWVHRGTPEQPGLVFGLDRGGSCIGRVFRVAAERKPAVAAYLYGRELVTPAYLPRLHPVHWDNRKQTALTFVRNLGHPQYAGKLDMQHAARVVNQARGLSGHNREYVTETLAHMRELGISDHALDHVVALIAGEN